VIVVSLSISRYSYNTPSEPKLYGLRRFIWPLGAAYLLRQRRNGGNFNVNEMIGKVCIFCTVDSNGSRKNFF
jgi:hypothetical protein